MTVELHAAQFGLAAPGESGQDDVELGLLGKGGGQVCDVVADAGAGAEQRGGVQRDSHPGMFAHVAAHRLRRRSDVTWDVAERRPRPGGPLLLPGSESPAVTQMAEMWRYRGLIGNFASRELKSKYKHSVLGWTWSLINPAATLAVYTLVFSTIFRATPPKAHDGMTTYVIYLFIALVAWNFFSNVVNGSMAALIGAGPLLKKIYFPPYAPVHRQLVLGAGADLHRGGRAARRAARRRQHLVVDVADTDHPVAVARVRVGHRVDVRALQRLSTATSATS